MSKGNSEQKACQRQAATKAHRACCKSLPNQRPDAPSKLPTPQAANPAERWRNKKWAKGMSKASVREGRMAQGEKMAYDRWEEHGQV